MSLVETVWATAIEQMNGIAERICEDYKREVTANLKHPGNSSGEAAGSIAIEHIGDGRYRIGSNNLHLYFFEEGNGTGGIPKGGKVPKSPMPMTFGSRGKPQGYAMFAHNYKGKHINKKVAAKYG